MIPMLEETDAISCLLNERNAALNRIEVLETRITQLESDNATIVEDADLVMDENKRLKRIAEAAVRYLTHQDYDGLLNALRAENYLGGGE